MAPIFKPLLTFTSSPLSLRMSSIVLLSLTVSGLNSSVACVSFEAAVVALFELDDEFPHPTKPITIVAARATAKNFFLICVFCCLHFLISPSFLFSLYFNMSRTRRCASTPSRLDTTSAILSIPISSIIFEIFSNELMFACVSSFAFSLIGNVSKNTTP